MKKIEDCPVCGVKMDKCWYNNRSVLLCDDEGCENKHIYYDIKTKFDPPGNIYERYNPYKRKGI